MSEDRKIEWGDLGEELQEIINGLERYLSAVERQVTRLRVGLVATAKMAEPDDG